MKVFGSCVIGGLVVAFIWLGSTFIAYKPGLEKEFLWRKGDVVEFKATKSLEGLVLRVYPTSKSYDYKVKYETVEGFRVDWVYEFELKEPSLVEEP